MLKKIATIALLAGVSSVAMAGPWTVKIGGSLVSPQDKNSSLAGGAFKVDASAEYGFTPSVEYAFEGTPYSVEVLLGLPFEHDVRAGNVGNSPIASFKHLPPTITAKYNFVNSTPFTPYVGAGLNITYVWDEEIVIPGAKLEADPSFGLAGQVGVKYEVPQQPWGIYADVRYAQIESDLKLDGADIGTLEVNPWVYTVGISYKF